MRAALRRSLIGPVLYALSAVVALLSAPAALVVTAVVAGYFTLTPRHLRRPAPGPVDMTPPLGGRS